MKDIDKMTSGEWLAYREDLIDSHYARGHKLIPSPDCSQCDVDNDYTCFQCEFFQIDEHKEAV
jgi:hypothetical protein